MEPALDPAHMDIDATAQHIRRGFSRVALQFPDEFLSLAPGVLRALELALVGSSAELFVMADTSFDGFQIDYVAAQHLGADLIVHYGPADLEAEGPIEVRFVFGELPLAVSSLESAYAAQFEAGQRVLVVFGLHWQHHAADLTRALDVSHPGAAVCTVNIERKAEAAAASAASAVESSPLDADNMLGAGHLLGRQLPLPLSAAQLPEYALLYVGVPHAPPRTPCPRPFHAQLVILQKSHEPQGAAAPISVREDLAISNPTSCLSVTIVCNHRPTQAARTRCSNLCILLSQSPVYLYEPALARSVVCNHCNQPPEGTWWQPIKPCPHTQAATRSVLCMRR